jgi:hypothetical protein
MADINRVSQQVLDYAERFADVVDAAQGRGNRKGNLSARWLVLPLAGAGAYALMTNGAFTRQARGVLSDAKERASELPDDLLGRVRQTSPGSTNGRKTTRQPAKRSTNRGRTSQRRRTTSKTASSR